MKYLLLPGILLSLCLSLSAQTVPTPTQTDAIIIDNGTPGKADPNDRIRYNVTIQNTGGAPATGGQLNTVVDPRTTLVPGSFRSSPLAANDAYTCTGNVGITVPAASGVKANDFDDNLGLATLAVTTLPVNGTVTLNNDGSFTYSPNAGFAGVETFGYTLTDGNSVGAPAPLTDVATVTITVSNVIWFVDNSVAGPGTGTVIDPFKTLASAGTASGVSHVIFVKNTGTRYPGGITLKNNQLLFGTGHSGGTNLADASVLPFTLAPNSNPLPAIGGTRPIITSVTNGITLASGNTIRGVDVGRCQNGAKIFGSAFGTLTVGNTTSPDVALTGNRKILDLTNGAFAATSKFVSMAAGDSSATQALSLNTVSGSLASGSTTITQSQGGVGIDIQNSTASLDFGTTSVSHFGNGAAISITSSGTGSVTFGSLAVTNGSPGLFASTGGTINIGGTSSAITGRPALDITNTSFGSGATFASITSANSGGKGVNLDNVTGSVIINGGSITNAAGIAFDLNAGSSTVTYAGTISNANRAVEITGRSGGTVTFSGNITNTGSGINIATNTGGTIVFSGASKSLNTGGNTAVTLASNTGATINFTGGGLVTTTTSGTGYSATSGGTINVTGSGNTLTSTTGVALNVVNTTIGASNLNFQSISANGAPNGIVLNSTGAVGGLTVTGTGGNGTGGTIQNITSRGVSASSTTNLSLSNITFNNANTTDGAPCGAGDNSGCNAAIYINTSTNATLDNVNISTTAQQGINLREVNGFQLLNSTVINGGAGGQTEEADLYALNIFGTVNINNSSLTVPAERAAVIYNTSKTMVLTVNGSTFGMNQTQPLGADALEIGSYGASNTTIDIVNSTFIQPKTNGLQVITEGTSFSSVDITGSTFDPGTGLAAAIDLDVNNTASMQFNIVNNPSIKGKGINIVNVFAFPNATFEGRINSNTIVSNGGSGTGVRVISQGNGNSKVEIKNNDISGILVDFGIDVVAQMGSGRVDATITDNTVSIGAAAAYAIEALAGASSSTFTNKVCANIANNITTAAAGAIGNARYRSATPSHELLLQGGGAAAAVSWNANTNSPLSPTAIIVQSGIGVFTFGATCAIPTNPGP